MSDVVETRGALRLRIELHESPEPPYNEGSAPILRVQRHVSQVTETTNYRLSPRILEAARLWGPGHRTFLRYLKICHGVTRMERYGSDRTVYYSFDPADWRQLVGLTDEHLSEHPDVNPADMSEWQAYCEGDVYGYVVERRVGWRRLSDGSKVTTWAPVADCWGFYGYEHAVESGLEAMAALDDGVPDEFVTVKVEVTMTYAPADYRLAYDEDDMIAPDHMKDLIQDMVREGWRRMDWGSPAGIDVSSVTRS